MAVPSSGESHLQDELSPVQQSTTRVWDSVCFLAAQQKLAFLKSPCGQHSRARAASTQFFCETFVPPFIKTSPMRFMPLHAIHRLPSGVCTMFRTTPPPEGIAHV